jgi:hypothetical protein
LHRDPLDAAEPELEDLAISFVRGREDRFDFEGVATTRHLVVLTIRRSRLSRAHDSTIACALSGKISQHTAKDGLEQSPETTGANWGQCRRRMAEVEHPNAGRAFDDENAAHNRREGIAGIPLRTPDQPPLPDPSS